MEKYDAYSGHIDDVALYYMDGYEPSAVVDNMEGAAKATGLSEAALDMLLMLAADLKEAVKHDLIDVSKGL